MRLIKYFLLFILTCVWFAKVKAQNCTLSATVSSSSTVICPGSTTVLTVNATGGTPNYSYKWNTGDTTQNINITDAGTYTVTVKDNTPGCGPVAVNFSIAKANFLNVSDATICANSQATFTASGGDTYRWYDAPNNGNLVGQGATFVTPVLTGTTTYYLIAFNNGCQSDVKPVTANVIPLPNAPSAANATICSGLRATLSVSSAGDIFDWYTISTGGSSLITSRDFTTPVLNAVNGPTTVTYYVQGYNGSCPGPRTAVTVTVNPLPQTPAVSGTTVCYASGTTLSVSNSASINGTVNWYDTSFGNVFIAQGTTFTTPSLTASTTYYAQTISPEGCTSSRLAVVVTVKPEVPHPSAPGVVICSGNSAALSASSTQNGTAFEWFDALTGGNSLATTATFNTPPLNSPTSYYVQGTYNGCTGPRTKVDVGIVTAPTLPTAAGVSICNGNSAAITAIGSNSNYQWFSSAVSNMVLSTAATFITPVLSTNTTYYVQAVNGQCASNRVAVNVTVNQGPAAPTISGATICPGSTATLSTNSPGTITWFNAATGGDVVASGPSFNTPALTVTTTYYAESSNGTCSSVRTPVTVTVTAVPDPIFRYAFGTFCKASGGTAAPLINAALTYNNASKLFTSDPGLIINPATGVINIGASSLGPHTVTFSFTGNACVGSGTAIVNISPNNGSPTFSYSTYTYCQYDPNPSPNFGAGSYGGAFTATPAGLVFVDNNTGQIDLTASAPGTYNITNKLLCNAVPYIDPQQIVINPRPPVNAGPNQFLALNTTAQLAGTSASASVLWTIVSGGGQILNSTSLNAQYKPANGETSAVLKLATNNPGAACPPQISQVKINYSALGPPVVSPAVTTICSGSTTVLTASGSTSGNYQWYDAATGGTLLSTNNPFMASPPVTTVYYVQTVVGGVTSDRSAVNINVTPSPIITVSGNTICFDNQATLTASVNVPVGPTDIFKWYDANGTLLSTGASYTTTYLQQNATYYVEFDSSPCSTSRIPVTVVVNPLPQISSAITGSICTSNLFTYQIVSNSPVATFAWTRAAVAGISNQAVVGTGSTISETLINTGNRPINVVYNIVASANGCSGLPINLIVTVNPALTVISALKDTVCNTVASNYRLLLNFTPSSVSWSRSATAGIKNAAVSGQTSPVISEVLTNTTALPIDVTYVYTATSGCTASIINLTVTVNPTLKVTSSGFATICSGDTFNYNVTSATPGVTFTWVRQNQASINPVPIAAGTGAVISETLTNTGTTPVNAIYKITPVLNGCQGNVFTFVLTVNPKPFTPVISGLPAVCTGSVLALSTKTVSGASYTWTGPKNFASNLQNPTIPNVTKANAGTYSLVVTVDGCNSLAGNLDVAVDVQPVALAGPDQNDCVNDIVQLNGTIIGGGTNGVWSTNGSGSFVPSAMTLNAIYMPSAADLVIGKVILTLSTADLDNCNIASSSLTIIFVSTPVVNAGGNQDICNQNTSVKINGTVSNAVVNVYWTTDGSGSFTPSANAIAPIYLISSSDVKKVSVKVFMHASNVSCEATDSATINLIPPAIINIKDKIVYLIRNTKKLITPEVDKLNVQYLWGPNLYIDDNTIKNPTITAIDDVTYTLKVTDALGCISTDQFQVIVLDPIVTYNTFTPNGDNINDKWVIPSLSKYPGAMVDIYNRYGMKLFHSNGYGTPWDGTYNGQLVPLGVYYYVIKTAFNDQVFSGYVTVIR